MSPRIMAMVVVLPAPLPPSSPVMVPGSSANEMPSTAQRGLALGGVDLGEAVDFDGGGGGWHARGSEDVNAPRTCGAMREARGKGQ